MTQVPFRLAFRVEGDNWCCYFARPETMEDAIFLASIRMSLVAVPRHKKAFQQLMKAGLRTLLNDLGAGKIERWKEQPAPEHERSGSA